MLDAPELSASQRAMLAAQRGVNPEESQANGASLTYLNYAHQVLRHAPHLVDDVLDGAITLDAAIRVARACRDGTPRRERPRVVLNRIPLQTQWRLEREERIRTMAEEGHSEEAIAQALGVSREHVMTAMHRLGLQNLRQKLGANQHISSDRAMDKLVIVAQPPEAAISAIDWSALDPARLEEWEQSLDQAISHWSALRNRLRRLRRHG